MYDMIVALVYLCNFLILSNFLKIVFKEEKSLLYLRNSSYRKNRSTLVPFRMTSVHCLLVHNNTWSQTHTPAWVNKKEISKINNSFEEVII